MFGLVRVGCMPSNIQQHPSELDNSSCAYKLNEDIQIFNTKLQTLVEELNANHTDAAFTYINSYDIDSNVTNNGTDKLLFLLVFFSGIEEMVGHRQYFPLILLLLQHRRLQIYP